MRNDYKAIVALFCLGALGKFLKNKQKEKISGIRYEMPGVERDGITNANVAMNKLLSDQAGNLNGDIFSDGNGEIHISDYLKQRTGLPTFLTYKWQIKKAISELKTVEKVLIWSSYLDEDIKPISKKQLLDIIYSNHIEQIVNDGATTKEQSYLYALYYMATGGKYIWYDQDYKRGVKSELLATNRNNNGRVDRAAKSKILNDKTGISPENQAEQIRSYNRDADDYYIKEGILEAISEVNTPNEAYDKLQFVFSTTNLHDTVAPF
ncbi:MAG: hypothetical protein EOM76_02630 [Sphingobacteriia bacterium]|jgi:hypothetical protein|nr:hypothetical protein [Paludibacteraceae bacterium]NCA79073.1 hypothetical protein [Sphingobacteriia bacterium]